MSLRYQWQIIIRFRNTFQAKKRSKTNNIKVGKNTFQRLNCTINMLFVIKLIFTKIWIEILDLKLNSYLTKNYK